MKYKSFTEFIHESLMAIGFRRKGKSYWYRKDQEALIVVNLQKSSFGKGVYLNYGLCFSAKRYPKDFECEVFGRNPGLSAGEFSEFQDYLDDVPEICVSQKIQERIRTMLKHQIGCLSEWQDLQRLRRRLLNGRVLEMIVNRVKLRI